MLNTKYSIRDTHSILRYSPLRRRYGGASTFYTTRHTMPDLEHPIIQKLLEKRGIVTQEEREAFFFPDYERHLHSPFLFVGMTVVVERVKQALHKKEKVGIFGDFDADGVTGSAILREGFETLGLETVVYIPDKNVEGHGVSILGLQHFLDSGVSLVFTVDCGISNYDEIAWAKEKGMDVVVIDHHHIPPKLPPALVSINAKMPESGYPFRELCGAGTAFKVLQGVYRTLAPEKEDQLKWLLDLVAVGTVADCMPIVGENRVLVKYGLIVLSKTRRPGLQELYTVGRIRIGEDQLPNAETIGFSIAPRINAAGRMAHAITAHELLVTNDRGRARELAETLEKHNKDRQKITASITDEVRALVKEKFLEKCCVLSAETHYPLGIVGLVAGRIAEEFKKPTAILTRGETESHGSFRSIPGVSVISAIEQCGDLLVRYGGHEQAAGMIIKNENIEEFYERFQASVAEMIQATNDSRQTTDEMDIITNDPRPTTDDDESDMYVSSVDFFTLDFVAILKQFEPFGIGNVEPVFKIPGAIIREVRYVGSGEKHLKMILEIADKAEKRFIDAIGFHLGGGEMTWTNGTVVDVVGNIQENVWNGRRSVQVMIKTLKRVA